MTKSNLSFSALVLLLLGLSSPAHAFLSGSLVGGFNVGYLNGYDSIRSSNSGFGGMGGLILEMRVGPISVEGGAIYSARNYSYYQRTGEIRDNIDVSSHVVEFPVLARLWVNDNIGLGFGGYYANYIGNLDSHHVVKNFDSHRSIEDSEYIYLDNDQHAGYDIFNRKTFEYGAIASVKAAVETKHMVLFMDVRYLYGLSDNTIETSQNRGSHTRDFETLAGIGFRL